MTSPLRLAKQFPEHLAPHVEPHAVAAPLLLRRRPSRRRPRLDALVRPTPTPVHRSFFFSTTEARVRFWRGILKFPVDDDHVVATHKAVLLDVVVVALGGAAGAGVWAGARPEGGAGRVLCAGAGVPPGRDRWERGGVPEPGGGLGLPRKAQGRSRHGGVVGGRAGRVRRCARRVRTRTAPRGTGGDGGALTGRPRPRRPLGSRHALPRRHYQRGHLALLAARARRLFRRRGGGAAEAAKKNKAAEPQRKRLK